MRLPIRIILAGEGGVGKTTLLRAYLGKLKTVTEQSSEISTKMTIGVDVEGFIIEREGAFPIVVVDLGGQQQFMEIRKMMMKYANVVVLVFDQTYPRSFAMLDWWMENIAANLGDVPVILVENKTDSPSRIPDEQVSEFIGRYPQIVGFVKTSAVLGSNVKELFTAAIKIGLGEEYVPGEVLEPARSPK
ncbi:MAG: Rab family GTPase [Candidatus Korarchaeota archaeon]